MLGLSVCADFSPEKSGAGTKKGIYANDSKEAYTGGRMRQQRREMPGYPWIDCSTHRPVDSSSIISSTHHFVHAAEHPGKRERTYITVAQFNPVDDCITLLRTRSTVSLQLLDFKTPSAAQGHSRTVAGGQHPDVQHGCSCKSSGGPAWPDEWELTAVV